MNVLFVCTLNKARSVAAERLYRRIPGLSVRSAGISPRARHQLGELDLQWADWVIVFDAAQERWIRETFAGELPRISDVGISDDYLADDPELLVQLRECLTPLLGPAPGPATPAPRRCQRGD